MKILFVSTGHVDDDSRLLKESAALQAAGHDVTILGWREEPHGRMTTDTFEFDGQKLKAIFTGIKLSYGFVNIYTNTMRFRHVMCIPVM